METIKVKTNVRESLMTGRNGCFPIQAIQISRGNGKVFIDGIGKSGKVLHGGFIVPEQALVDLCGLYLDKINWPKLPA